MSRAAQSKSRADKKQSPPTPAVTHEIVPGKFTDVDWNRMLELDDGGVFIGEIVDEVVSKSLGIIYDKYIERQLLPYTISQAKEALLTIIDWRFLACDPGEAGPSTDPTWQEDEEPVAAIPDCWAQGSVPKTFVSTRAASVASLKEDPNSLVNEAITEEAEPEPEPEVKLDEESKPWVVTDEQVLALDETVAQQTIPESNEEGPPLPAPPTGAKTKRRKFRPHKGRLVSAGVNNMKESLEDTERRITTEERMRELAQLEQQTQQPFSKLSSMPKSVGSILKSANRNMPRKDFARESPGNLKSNQFQSGRPPGSRDVYYDEQGNVIAMSKINPERLPTHRIKTKFYVVDPEVEAAQARLDAMRTGRSTAAKPKKAPLPTSDKTKLDKSSILDYRSVKGGATSRHPRQTTMHHGGTKSTAVTPLPPPMIESMELAPGVVVREGDRVKKGPRQLTRTADRLPKKEALRSVAGEPDMRISVKELLGNKGPLVRIEATPVPPIINKHTMNNTQKIMSS